MEIRKKAVYSIILWVINSIGLMIITSTIDYRASYIEVIFTIAVGLYITSLRCPGCQHPILRKSVKIYGVDIYYWSINIPRKCQKCGIELK